jgi:hypothetical protein
LEFLKQLQELGLPAWVLIFAAILWILSTLGILQSINKAASRLFEFTSKRIEDAQENKQQISLTETETRKLSTLREDYKSNWLMEQVTTNQSESLVQLGEANSFIRDNVDKKLDTIEGGVTENKQDTKLINQRLDNIDRNIAKFYSELDITNRHLEELKELVKNALQRRIQ